MVYFIQRSKLKKEENGMKSFKKTITLCIVAVLLIFTLLTLGGCYIIDSGSMSEIEGSYVLSRYSTDEDEIAANDICLYIMIKSDGTGYYAYSSKSVPLHYSALRCRFVADSEEAGKYSYVEINFDGDSEWHSFGINAGAETLNSSKPKYKGNLFAGDLAIDYYIDVDFKRVDTRTSIYYMRSKLGEAAILPYGALRLDGSYFFGGIAADSAGYEPITEPHPFVYLYLDIDLILGTGKAWYMLSTDEVEMTEEFSVEISEGSDGGYKVKLGDKEYDAVVNGSYIQYIRIPYPLGGYSDAYIELNPSGYKTEEEILADIDMAKLSYERWKDEEKLQP